MNGFIIIKRRGIEEIIKITSRQKKTKAFPFFISCFLFIFFIDSEAYTQGGVRIGQARLRPLITVEQRLFDDDAYFIIFPALQLDFPFGRGDRHLAQIIYSTGIAICPDHARENYTNQSVGGKLHLNLPRGRHLLLSHLYRDTTEDADREFVERIDRTENRWESRLGREMNRLFLELGYVHFSRRFGEALYSILEYDEAIFTLTGHYQISPRTRLLSEYNRGEINYHLDPIRDGHYDQIRLGLRRELTDKTTGIVKVGFQDRDYEQVEQLDKRFGVAEIGLSTIFTEATRLQLNYHRTAAEPVYDPVNFFITDRISAQLTQRLGRRFTGIGSLAFENNDYAGETAWGGETKKRVDNIWTIGLELQYHLRKGMKVKLGYEYRNRDSNFNNQDYRRDRVSLSFTFD